MAEWLRHIHPNHRFFAFSGFESHQRRKFRNFGKCVKNIQNLAKKHSEIKIKCQRIETQSEGWERKSEKRVRKKRIEKTAFLIFESAFAKWRLDSKVLRQLLVVYKTLTTWLDYRRTTCLDTFYSFCNLASYVRLLFLFIIFYLVLK